MYILQCLLTLLTDKILSDKVNYIIRRFFLTNVWEYPNQSLIDSYSALDLKFIEDFDLQLLSNGYTKYEIKNIDDMIQYLKEVSPRLDGLTTRYFIEQFITTYHGSSIMAMDYLPYTFFIIINVLISSFLISQVALNDIIKNTNGINKFYIELSKTI